MSSSTKVIHRFLRNPNIDSNVHNRVANRFDPFNNTVSTLTDPATQRTLTLIGSTNSSTTLAYRTRLLLQKLKPDAVYVQASPMWWKYAQHVDVQTQGLFREASKKFPQPTYKFQNHLRGILFRTRYQVWKYIFEAILQFPEDFGLLTPGLETYYALKYASDNKIQQHFGGHVFDPLTVEALRLEPDLYPHTLFWKAIRKTTPMASSWTSQYDDFINTLHVRGGEAFAESIDRSRINFLVGCLSRIAPKQKQILIDARDERIFRDINEVKGKNIVAIVNQWHMEGVETHWRKITGTEVVETKQSPIADMDIDQMQEKTLINEWLREYTSAVTKSEPATYQDYLTNYHKQNFENERTRHTHHDTHEDIPEPGQPKHGHHH